MSLTTTKIIIRRENGEVVSQHALGPGEHFIGRDQSCAIFIEDEHVSRQHAKLIISADAIEIEDLSSTSGTFLDGMAVSGRIPVQPGQKVHISDLYLDIEQAGFRELVKGARLGEGRFTLTEKLGQGGMGAVWKALDEQTGQPVALKLLPQQASKNLSGLIDLEREVKKTLHFNHPNIVQIGGLWQIDGEPAFITLEYVEGNNLDELRSSSSHNLLPWASVQHYMLQLCAALGYAHNQQVAHRDIKPSNLLIDRSGQLKLADFGIAASIAGTTGTLTTDVMAAGTPSYMSPQQIEGNKPQPTDDIYSLGSTFYDLLTGTPPFYQGQIIHQVLSLKPAPMADRLKELGATNDIPDYVAAMVMACLQKDPNKRPASADAIGKWIASKGKEVELVQEQRIVWAEAKEEATTRNPPSLSGASQPDASWEKRSKALAYGIVGAILSIVIGTAIILHEPGGRSGDQNENAQGQPVISAKMQAQLKERLVAYYPFNGNAKDESGNGHNGEVKGATLAADRHGKDNSAYSFDGKDDLIEIADNDALDLGDAPEKEWSISIWCKPIGVTGTVPGSTLIGKVGINGLGGSDYSDYRVTYENNKWKWCTGKARGGRDEEASMGHEFDLQKDWTHLTVTYNKNSTGTGTKSIHINGEKVKSGGIGGHKCAALKIPLRIGADINSEYRSLWSGLIDDVRIYNRALSEEEVAALYDLEKPDYSKSLKEGLVAYYPFNGNAKDESGNGNDGEIKGPALTTDRHGKNGAAYRFDGMDDYIRIADSKSLDVKHITITSWIKLDSEKRIMCLLAKSIETNAGRGQYLLFLNTETPEPLWGSILFVHVTVSSGAPSSGAPRLSPQKPRPFNGRGEWSHLVVTLDDKQRVIYIDGEKFYAKANVEGGAIIDAPAAFTEGDLRIGKEWNTHPFWFSGSIDDVRIYNRALSAGEIKALYDLEKPAGK